MLESDPPLPRPGKTRSSGSPRLSWLSTANAWEESGTRCGRPAFMRSAGTVQIAVRRSISRHRAPSVSPVRAAVRIVNSNASAPIPSRKRSVAMKAANSTKGRAARCLTGAMRPCAGNTFARWPFQRAGFASVRYPRTAAQSRTFSIRPRSLLAVSVFEVQSGSRTSVMCRTSTSETANAPNTG